MPSKVEYSLTNIGSTFIPIMETLAKWDKEYKELINIRIQD